MEQSSRELRKRLSPIRQSSQREQSQRTLGRPSCHLALDSRREQKQKMKLGPQSLSYCPSCSHPEQTKKTLEKLGRWSCRSGRKKTRGRHMSLNTRLGRKKTQATRMSWSCCSDTRLDPRRTLVPRSLTSCMKGHLKRIQVLPSSNLGLRAPQKKMNSRLGTTALKTTLVPSSLSLGRKASQTNRLVGSMAPQKSMPAETRTILEPPVRWWSRRSRRLLSILLRMPRWQDSPQRRAC